MWVRALGRGRTWYWHPALPSPAPSLLHGVKFLPCFTQIAGDNKALDFTGSQLEKALTAPIMLTVFAEWMEGGLACFSHCGAKCNPRGESIENGRQEPSFYMVHSQ